MASFDFAQAASRHHPDDTGGDAHMRVSHQVDVTDAVTPRGKQQSFTASPPTTGPNLDSVGNSSKQGGIGPDQPDR